MLRRFSPLLLIMMLAACAVPFASQPTSEPVAPTAAVSLATAPPVPATEVPEFITQEPAPTRTSSEPTAEAGPTAPPVAAGDLDDPARLAAADPIERDQVALAEAFKNIGDIPTVARTTPLDVKVGEVETFWVADFATDTNYQITAKLRYTGSIVLMYVDTAIDESVDQAALEQSAKQFEEQIYPRDRELFGQEWSPGVDGDVRLTIVNTALRGGAAGYFSAADEVVKAANRFSNEREMFVMGVTAAYALGSDLYASVLMHEFQHMIEWHQQRRSPAWFNEGMSMLAEDLNGYVDPSFPGQYLQAPDLQLTSWSILSAPHYGASQLFLRYFYEQYAGEKGLAELLKTDAGNNLEAFVPIAARKRPDIKRFADLFADWAVANVVNDAGVGDGRYTYKLLPGTAALSEVGASEVLTTVQQFGVDYLGILNGPLTVNFDGAETVGLTGTQPEDGRYAWWSNRGDDSVETLTRAFDLSGVQQATLQFATWYEIEKDYDYGFVTVSTDGGKNWTTLKGNTTTDFDPQGHNYGNGLTGVSGAPGAKPDTGTRGQWVEERMDLSPYAGKRVLLRFWVVNDDAYNAEGLLIDNIRIPELNYRDSAEDGDAGWEAQGFVRTTGALAQDWTLRFIATKDGSVAVEPVTVDAQGRASVSVPAGERAILAVMGTTEFTTEPATYSYHVTKP
jgi:immune inhibitor A